MKFRSPRLPVLFLAQFLVTLLIPLFLHLGVQSIQNHQHLPGYVILCEWIGIALNALLNHAITKQTDEYSTAALRKAEAACFPWASLWMILCCVPTMLGYGNGGYVTVYLLSCAVPVLMLLRAVLFWWYDSHGME